MLPQYRFSHTTVGSKGQVLLLDPAFSTNNLVLQELFTMGNNQMDGEWRIGQSEGTPNRSAGQGDSAGVT